MAAEKKKRGGLILAALIYFACTSGAAYFINQVHYDKPVVKQLRALGADVRVKSNGDVFFVDCYPCGSTLEPSKLLAGIPELQMLNFSSTDANDQVLGRLAKLKQVRELAVNNTQVTNDGLRHLRGYEALEVLNLDDNSEISDEGLEHLSQLVALRRLHMNHTSVSNEGLVHLAKLTNLQHLLLYDTKVDKAGVAKLKESLPNVSVTISD